MTRKDFEILCTKFLTDSLSPEGKNIFEKNLNSSNGFKKIYEEQKNIWETTSLKNIEPKIKSERDWSILESKIDFSETALQASKKSDWALLNWKPAAALMVIALIMLITFYPDAEKELIPINKMITVSTSNGEIKKLVLPDGSFVQLNNATTIEYPEKFSESSREIMLRGEAFFEVEKGVKPFVVNTQNAQTTVLGTEFNVRARDSVTAVVVREGLVNLSPKSKNTKGVNIPHDYVSIVFHNKSALTPKKVDANKLLGWLDGKMVFYRTPLKEIVKELERYYDKKVTINSDKLENLSITGNFAKNDIDTTLSMICLTLNLSYEQNTDGFIIKQK